jgi:hypothetical protein
MNAAAGYVHEKPAALSTQCWVLLLLLVATLAVTDGGAYTTKNVWLKRQRLVVLSSYHQRTVSAPLWLSS